MKNVMKNQSRGVRCTSHAQCVFSFKGLLLSVALSGLGVVAFAQSAEVCTGTPYTIASTVDASGASTYQWLENGQLISGASAATYVVPSNKAAGQYTYIRQAKSADCSEWQPSNEFAVTVFNCAFTAGTATSATATFVDPRDGKRYKTVVMPDGKTWFAQNLNYTKDLTYNAYSYEANGKQFTSNANGVPAIGSYWCPPQYWVNGAATVPVVSGSEADCNTYGALYTWETAMMVDGKYADESKTSSAWDESWLAGKYYTTGAPGSTANADVNNARGGTVVKGGGRGICPMGWHIPTDREWAVMLDAVEGNTTYTLSQTDEGNWGDSAAKSLMITDIFSVTDPGTGAWLAGTTPADNSTKFDLVPAGYVDTAAPAFASRGLYAAVQSSSVYSFITVWYRGVSWDNPQTCHCLTLRITALPLRCLKDQ
jgi:uncharacterized protein (TIGR02145 family)